ncbi:MAG: hypothetical protein JNJ88_13320 [Planctomycetes bacterium]|nr:hypothetical protein [Planctomycetota bacterium]
MLINNASKKVSTLAIAALISGFVSAQQVHVVDDQPGPGVNFTSLQAAHDAAAPGDILLVKSGTYQGLTVSKGITVTADKGALVNVSAAFFGIGVVVSNIPSGQSVVLREIHIKNEDLSLFSSQAFTILNCNGSVLLDHCSATGLATQSALNLLNSNHVAVSWCSFLGGSGLNASPIGISSDGAAAASVKASRLAAYDTTFQGGKGGNGLDLKPASSGGNGLEVTTTGASQLFASGCTFIGGAPGTGIGSPISGVGLFSQIAAFSATAYASTFSGSQGTQLAGPFTNIAGPTRSMEVTSPVREGALVTATVQCGPADLVYLFYAENADLMNLVGVLGPLQLELATMNTLPPPMPIACSGSALVRFDAPQLSASTLGRTFYAQPVFRSTTDGILLIGTAASVTILDSSL